MNGSNGKLDIVYLDFSGGLPEEAEGSGKDRSKKAKEITARVAKDLFLPWETFMEVRGLVGAASKELSGEIRAITSADELGYFLNPQGEEWIIRENAGDPVTQFYIRHPKRYHSNWLINAKSFHQFIFEEYRAELVNYCCSHCPAKKILIYKSVCTGVKLKGGTKKIYAGVSSAGEKTQVYSVSSETSLRQVEPLRRYLWIESDVRQGVDVLKEGGTLDLCTIQDFSFDTSAKVLKRIGADANLAKTFQFNIHIEC